MVKKAKESILKRIEEEFIRTTDTLWANEIEANMMVANISLGSAFIGILALVAYQLGLIGFGTSNGKIVLIQSVIELIISSALCYIFKGKKKWLKLLLLLNYCLTCARVESVLTSSVTLLMVFPLVTSIRYYSRPVTNFTAFIIILLSGIADYRAIFMGTGRMDLNYVRFVENADIFLNNLKLRDAIYVTPQIIDLAKSWNSYFISFYIPKVVMFMMVAIICSEVARKGRLAIFAQQAETKKTERISTELNLASNIQANMLPNIFPAFPERNDFDIYATMTPAKEVGGDFYDFFMVDDDHLALVMADVSGKGIPAAMFMVIAKTLIKDHAQLGLQPGQVFTRVNNILCEGNEAGLFVTAWMGILDLNTGKMQYSNAGHNPPLVMIDGKISYLKSEPGFVLAGLDDYNYKQFELDLKQGDKIFLYTDGATEATNSNDELYGEDRLINCLTSLPEGTNCADALHAVRADIDKFVGEAEQFDDLTLLAFDYQEKNMNNITEERAYDADVSKLHDVIAFVEEGLEKHDADMKSTMAITVALEEMFVNVAHYAYPDQPGKVTVGMRFEDDDVEIHLIDNGIPFNPLAKEDPDISLNIEERDIGGLGIYMVKKSMDECSYEREGNQNHFIMKRKFK